MRLHKKEMERLLNQHRPASFWKRAIAFIIDIAILEFIILAPLQAVITARLGTPDSFESLFSIAQQLEPYQGIIIALSVLMAILSFAYFVLLEGLHQQTVGKALMNIHVVSTNKTLQWKQVMGRNITKALALTSFSLLFCIDIVYLLIKKERLSDKITHTGVEQ